MPANELFCLLLVDVETRHEHTLPTWVGCALSARADAPYGLRSDAYAPGHCTTWSGPRAAPVDRNCLSRSRQYTGLPGSRQRDCPPNSLKSTRSVRNSAEWFRPFW